MLYKLDAVNRITIGLQCILDLIFGRYAPSRPHKLGMHKMELGDSVYAAERIMKKRIRKVSFVSFFRKRTL